MTDQTASTKPTAAAVRPASARRRPHVAVVGGGFAGLAAIKELSKSDVDVTLIDRHTYNTFQPLLYQVATAGLNPGDVTYFLRATRMKQRNVSFRQGDVIDVDSVNNVLHFADGGAMDFDYLILASGATTNYFGTPGAEKNSMAIYTRAQALQLRDRIFTNLEHAAAASTGDDLTIVVVGAGPTGVEMAGALAELRNDAMAVVYPELDPRRTHIVLLEMGDKVLAPFAPRLREYTARSLRERGVEVRLGTAVKEVREDGVELGNGEFLKAAVIIWATGVAVPKVVGSWGLEQGRGGRLVVGEDLRVTGLEHVFACGDVSITPEPLPQLSQPALQQGKQAAKNIASLVIGRTTDPFVYKDKGTMATIGRRAAIADIKLPKGKSLKVTGSLAWLIWMFVHIQNLLANRNRLATFINLATKYLAPSRRTNPIVGDVPVFEQRQRPDLELAEKS